MATNKLSEIYSKNFPGINFDNSPITNFMNKFVPVTRTLPGGQTYQSPVVAQQGPQRIVGPVAQAPVVPPAPAPVQRPVAPAPQAPVAQAPQGVDYSKYTDPATGTVMNPQQYADFLAKRVSSGSISNYAGNTLTQGPQSSAQLRGTATDLNNERNDIATGTTDPYGAASKSGIAYSPSEMAAIEKAYAGIYDPALKDVFSKLDKREKEDAAALTSKNKLSEMAQQHKYDVQLKQTPTAADIRATSGSGPYVAGANPVVDAWAQRIFEGSAKITDIPSADKGLRNSVTVALQAQGNQSDGRPTTTEIGKQTLDAAKRLLTMFDAGEGISTVGTSRLFGGGIATPGSDSFNFKNLFENLVANRSLDGAKFLKGAGSVSDAERQLLKSAMAELNLGQGEEAFRKSLQSIIDKLEGNAGGTGEVVTAPDGTAVEITD